MTMKQKPQLGKGMAALLGGSPSMHTKPETQTSSDNMIETPPLLVPVEKIIPNRNQPRKIFKEKELLELAESIKENGVIQPLIVTQNENGSFDLVAGERRLKASKLAGLERVPVVIK
ncbi:MAG: ParB N-terminal domain-containing protein, partial [Proteobacteria bacterium]|nr:ParB N-terminal domain-containing protein [Pseudomonadota bacterium]